MLPNKRMSSFYFSKITIALLKIVTYANRDVDHRTFFAKTETSCHREHDANRLDQQGPFSKKPTNNKTTQNGFNLKFLEILCTCGG